MVWMIGDIFFVQEHISIVFHTANVGGVRSPSRLAQNLLFSHKLSVVAPFCNQIVVRSLLDNVSPRHDYDVVCISDRG
jgi:hypothetical protein